jgi:tryptophan halogenase
MRTTCGCGCRRMSNLRPFHHAWQRARADGLAPRFNDFSLCAALGDAGKFLFPHATKSGAVAGLRYALHFDAGLVAQYLRSYSERLGVSRLQNTMADATLGAMYCRATEPSRFPRK